MSITAMVTLSLATVCCHFPIDLQRAGGAGDIHLDPPWRRCSIYDVFDGFGDSFAEVSPVAGEVQLDKHRLTIGAFRGGRREGIPPEIMDVLYMRIALS